VLVNLVFVSGRDHSPTWLLGRVSLHHRTKTYHRPVYMLGCLKGLSGWNGSQTLTVRRESNEFLKARLILVVLKGFNSR